MSAALQTYPRVCVECGDGFAALTDRGEFCASACRNAWNHRRHQRGADLYDLFMATRWDRPTAKALKLWRLLNRMASKWRDEDVCERGGRPSWRPAREVVLRHVILRGDIVWRGRA